VSEATQHGPSPAPCVPDGRTGLFFCRCGPNLGARIRLDELEDPARWPGAAAVETHAVLCSPEGKAWLAERIRAGGLNRVVVAACSPREHEATFRAVLSGAGRSPWHLQMVNLREQVDWIGGNAAGATERAVRLVRAGLRRVALHQPIPAREIEVTADVLVVGGGAAGISAALALAQKRRRVVLVERAFVLGGLGNQLDEIFPDLECASCFMEPVLDRVLHHDRIDVLTGAEIRRVRGAAGRFAVDVVVRPRRVDPAACLGCGACAAACPVEVADELAAGLGTRRAIGLAYPGCLPHVSAVDPAACLALGGGACTACVDACAMGAVRLDEAPSTRSVEVGAIVLATGMRPGEARRAGGAITTYQLERMLHPNGPTAGEVRGPDGRPPGSVLLALDGADGSDADLGARELLKLAHLLRKRLPAARIAVAGGIGRAPQLASVAAALVREGVELRDTPWTAGGPDGAELVVIHPPALPAEGAGELARLLRVPADPRGFVPDRGASPFEPTATRIAGVYVAGAAAGPRALRDAIRDGAAAAGLVLASLQPGETRPLEPLAAEVDPARCGGCGVCEAACPFGAIAIVVEGGRRRAVVEPVHCRGCGTCAAGCPTGAASARHFTRAQISAEISALLAGGA
jgi:heterodisulfide reductase subunit A